MVFTMMSASFKNNKQKKSIVSTRKEIREVKSKLNQAIVSPSSTKKCFNFTLADLFMLDAEPISFCDTSDLISRAFDIISCTSRETDIIDYQKEINSKSQDDVDNNWRQPLEPYNCQDENNINPSESSKSYSRDTVRNRRYLRRKGMHRILDDLSEKYAAFSACNDGGSGPLQPNSSMFSCSGNYNIAENFNSAVVAATTLSSEDNVSGVSSRSSTSSSSAGKKEKNPALNSDAIENAALELVKQLVDNKSLPPVDDGKENMQLRDSINTSSTVSQLPKETLPASCTNGLIRYDERKYKDLAFDGAHSFRQVRVNCMKSTIITSI